MIGLLDLTEHDRQALLRLAELRLVWFPETPREWAARPPGSVWVWLNARHHSDAIATVEQVEAVYRLQRAGLVGPTRPGMPLAPTRAGARMVNALHADGWQPPDRAPLAVAATVRKASRPRKRRAS